MEASEASAPEGRALRIFAGILTAIALMPVAGMVLLLAMLPALPIALAVGAALWPVNRVEDRRQEAALGSGRPPWIPPRGTFGEGVPAHAT